MRVVVAGGSVAGLAAALALAARGHRVDVLEATPPPPDGPGEWRRAAVPQALHAHTFTSLGTCLLRDRAPELLHELLAAGATLLDLTRAAPPGGPPVTDPDLIGLACRRTVFERVLHGYVAARPGVRVRHGHRVTGVLVDDGRVRGVRLGGQEMRADLVVDATGRRGAARSWLAAAGIPLPADRVERSAITSFSRLYRRNGAQPPGVLNRGNAAGGIWDGYAAVLHLGDGATFTVALGTLPADRTRGRLRDSADFTRVAAASPFLGPWLAPGASEPLSAVHALTCPPNVLRAAAVHPPVAGLHPVGDAAAVTDPIFGRGMSLAFSHAFALADLLDAHPAVDSVQRAAAGRLAEAALRPWFEHAAAADRARTAAWTAGTPAAGSPAFGLPGVTAGELAAAAAVDGTVWRALTRTLMSLDTPQQAFAGNALAVRVRAATGNRERPAAGARA
ncbi:FAD-dependent oxidoreductase [Streptomyces sp. NPDC021020]|uniref:FAD-dependent oxidoreductase n=1 Tax=Streptomyces sp. NPDC021020 TaxID=3365109 RepID=UPI0037A00F62